MAPIKDRDYYLSVIKPIFYLAVSTFVLFSFLGDGIFATDEEENVDVTLTFETVIGFIILLAFSSILFYIIFTKLRSSGIRVIYGFILFLMQVVFLLEVISKLSEISNNLIFQAGLIFISSIGFFFLFYLIYTYTKPVFVVGIRNFNIFLASVTAGRVISLSLEFWTLIFFSFLLSIFDIWSVFRGPLAKVLGRPKFYNQMKTSSEPEFDELILSENTKKMIQDGTPVYITNSNRSIIGIGDFLIYSILMYSSMIEFAMIGLTISFLMITCGIILTFALLKRISPLPGLPIPVFLTIIGLLLLKFLV